MKLVPFLRFSGLTFTIAGLVGAIFLLASGGAVSAQVPTDPPAYICHSDGQSGKYSLVYASSSGDVFGH